MTRLFRLIGYGIAMMLLAILVVSLWRFLLWMLGIGLSSVVR